MSTFDPLAFANEAEKKTPLVNERSSSFDPLAFADVLDRTQRGIKTDAELAADKAEIERKAKLPKTWFGEFTHGFGRGVDQMQQMAYGLGALSSDAVGLDSLRDYFKKGVEQQEKDIAENPTDVPTYDKIDGFDSFMRYAFGSAGEVAPQIVESMLSGMAGAAIGAQAGTPGAAVGGIAGFIEKQAVREMVKEGLAGIGDRGVKKELVDYARGRIAKDALGDATKELLANRARGIAGKYGATTALALSSWGQETGSIYTDLRNDPNTPESDRKIAAIVGGFIAAAPETMFEGWIASKFFPGAKHVAKQELDAAKSYAERFMREYGKEILKVVPSEGGQEFAQTVIEEAAKNWADPSKRDHIFTFTDEQKKSFIDAAFKGAIGGITGGGVAAHAEARIPQHTDVKVRAAERDVLQRADDLTGPILKAETGTVDERLSSIAQQREEIRAKFDQADTTTQQQLNEQLAKLDAEEESLVNENTAANVASEDVKPTQNNPVSTTTPAQRAETQLRAFYAQIMPNREVSRQEVSDLGAKVEEKRNEVHSLVNEIEKTNPEYAAGLRQAFTDDVLHFMAAEGITVRHPTETDINRRSVEGFAAIDDGENIAITLATPEKLAQSNQFYNQDIPTVINHEVIHAADLVALRDQWRASDKSESFSKFEERVMKERGKAMIAAYPKLPWDLRKVYAPWMGNKQMSERAVGQEYSRMIVELARTGKLSEVTNAIARAQREGERNKDGAISRFLRNWIDAIKNLHGKLMQMFDPTTAPVEMLQAVDDINKVLDKYGVLVNESVKDKNAPLPTPAPPAVEATAPKPKRTRKPKVQEPVAPDELVTPKTPRTKRKKATEEAVAAQAGLVTSEDQTPKESAQSIIPDDTTETEAGNQDDSGQEQADRESGDATGRPQRGTGVSPRALDDIRGATEVSTGLLRDIATAKGSLTDRINFARERIAATAPEVADFFERVMVQAWNAHHTPGSMGGFNEKVANIKPVRGEILAERMQEEKFAYYIGNFDKDFTDLDHWIAGHQWGGYLLARDGVEQGASAPVADLSGDLIAINTGMEIVSEASAVAPTNINDKLQEAYHSMGLATTRPFSWYGFSTIDAQTTSRFDEDFGEDGWIIKSFNADANQGKGVITPYAVKALLAQDPNYFERFDTSELMVQRMYDLPEEVIEAYRANNTIVEGNEYRVHVITDIATGDVTVVPFGTFAKGSQTVKLRDRVPILFPDEGVLAAERVAHIAIATLPFEDRSGSFYGVDVIKTATGWGYAAVELNPTTPFYADPQGQGGMSGYLLENPHGQDAIVSAMRGELPLHAKFAKALVAPALVNENKEAANAAMPTEPEDIANALQIHFDGDMMGRLWLFTDRMGDSSTNPAYGATFSVKVGASFDDVQAKLEKKRADFASAPTNTYESTDSYFKPGAQSQMPPLRPRDEQLLREAVRTANATSSYVFLNIEPKEAELKRVEGEIPWENFTPMDLYYSTRTHTQSAVNAQVLVNENGDALKVAEVLSRDVFGQQFQITENNDSGLFGPNATLKAVYENVIRQLIHIDRMATAKGMSISARAYIRDLQRLLERNMRVMGNEAGGFNAYTGQSEKLWTGRTAVREYIDNLMSGAEKVLGKQAREKMQQLAAELNQIWNKYSGAVVNSPKVIALIRKLQSLVNESKFEKGVRQTVVTQLDKLREIVRKAAARAAEHISGDEDSEAYLNKAAENIIKDMSGVPKSADAPSELEVFRRVVSRMARDHAKDMGLISDPAKRQKVSQQEQFATILKNDTLYSHFTNALRDAYIKEYGGPNPSQQFLDEANTLYGRMANRMWRENMVKSLVNEKMGELETKFSDIVKDHYGRGEYEVGRVRDAIAEYMRDNGVDNDGLIDQLAQDVEDSMRDHIENARRNFFSSDNTIRGFLKQMQTTLSQVAKEHATHAESMRESFEEILVRDYGFPNTADLPIARSLADAMQTEFNKMVQAERQKILKKWMETESKDKNEPTKRKLAQAVDKILQLSNLGVMRQEEVYKALQEKFGLPPYDPEIAKKIQELGDIVGIAKTDRQKDIAKQELTTLLSTHKGFKTTESYISWMYYSMLSGISTPLVNIGGNLTSLMGYVTIEAIKHPTRIPRILSSMIRAATGVAQVEARESFWTGMALGKTGDKFFRGGNPIETDDAFFQSGFKNEGLKKADEAMARLTHKLLKGVKGKYIGRALMATDIFFYKVAQEAAYASRVPFGGTPQMWESAMKRARSEMLNLGQNPDDSSAMKRRQLVLAHSIYADLRMRDANGSLVNERVTAWDEANVEALDATFTNEPRGFLGFLAKHIERFTNDWPIGKLIIPFTRVAANVTNHMLEWTPYGFARYMFDTVGQGQNPFHLWEDGKWTRESDTALRAMLGTGAVMVLLAMSGSDKDKEEPFFTIYGDGPRDLNARRQLQQRGWKPNSIKVGGTYFSYLYTPLAMALSIVGKHLDQYRDGKIPSPHSVSLSLSAVALLEAVKNQSFLASVSDLMAAVDSPDPEAKVSKVFARLSTIPIPNIIKQLDKTIDPDLQQASGFWQTFLKEVPVVRHSLKPSLNVFGEEVSRTPGFVRLPGMDRFATLEQSDDPVFNLLGEKQLVVPGFSKGTRLGDKAMTEDQYYEYVQHAGPNIKKRIQAEINTLRKMTKDDAEDRIERIASEEKTKVRNALKAKYKPLVNEKK